jgi:hypothetical protein
MPPTEKVISSVAAEMVVISLGAGHQPMNLRLLIYIDSYAGGERQGRRHGRW